MTELKLNAHSLMLITVILAASSFPVGAVITNALPPAVMMLIRFLLAALFLSLFVFSKIVSFYPSWHHMRNYAILSLPLVVFFWCMFESLRHTSVLNTGALYTLVPVITAFFALLINREMTNKTRSFGLILGTFGALWIVFRGDVNGFMGLQLNYGDLIFIIGCVFLGLYNPLVKKFYYGEPMEVMTFWVLILGAGWLLILSSQDIFTIDWLAIEIKIYAGILYLSIFTTLITFFLLQLCVVRIGPTKVAAYGFLTPIFIIAFGVFFDMDKLETNTLPGIFLVIAAMFIIQYEPRLNSA